MKAKKYINIYILLTMIFLSGCKPNNLQGYVDEGVYKNDYFGFTVLEKLTYEFEDISQDDAKLNSFTAKPLFKLVDQESKDTIEAYCFSEKESIESFVEDYVSKELNKDNVVEIPCKDKEAGYIAREFKDDKKSYKLYFKESKGHYIMFKTTYKKEREKDIRTHYVTTIYIEN